MKLEEKLANLITEFDKEYSEELSHRSVLDESYTRSRVAKEIVKSGSPVLPYIRWALLNPNINWINQRLYMFMIKDIIGKDIPVPKKFKKEIRRGTDYKERANMRREAYRDYVVQWLGNYIKRN